jgi:Bacterial PH domain
VTRNALYKLIFLMAGTSAATLAGGVFEGMSRGLLAILTMGAVLLIALLAYWIWRMAVVADETGLVVRSLIRTWRVPWRLVQDIAVEPDARRSGGHMVTAHLANGRAVVLRALRDSNLGDGRAMTGEVAKLRQLWETWRGDDWAPIPKVQQAISDRRVYGESPWRAGAYAALYTSLPMIMGFFFNIATEHSVPIFNLFFNPVTVVAVPALAFAFAAAQRKSVGDERRRRHSTHPEQGQAPEPRQPW